MDSLTHTVLGACMGELIAGKKIGKKAMLWGALANNLPDIDVVTGLWMNQADALLAHRGFTHSFLFVILCTILLGWLFRNVYSGEGMRMKDWTLIWGSGLLVHILIDALNAYGTGWYEPFNHHRVSLNVLFVADPFYTISLLVSSIALLILKNKHRSRSLWAAISLVISCLYIVFATYNKSEINRITESNFQKQSLVVSEYISTPTPLNNFLWYVVAKNNDDYLIAYRSLFDKSENMTFTPFVRKDSLLTDYKDDAQVNKLIRFADGYYMVEQMSDTIIFNDMRFGQIGGWANPYAPFVFRYSLKENADNKMVIQQGRMEASGREAIRTLVERIEGI